MWQATLDAVQEINGRCIINITVEDTDKQRSYPRRIEYDDVAQMTLVQVREDVTNFAKSMASKGHAIDVLMTHIGDTFPLEV